MIVPIGITHAVTDLMEMQNVDLNELIAATGLDKRIVEAIVQERYTPSPQQREQVADALSVPRERIRWGHRALVEAHIHGPF